MFNFHSLFLAVFSSLVLCSMASPVVVRDGPVSLATFKAFNVTSPKQILKVDQARAATSMSRGKSGGGGGGKHSAPAMNAVVYSYVELTIGTQSNSNESLPIVGSQSNSTYKLIVDTGSSNTWVGAGKPYKVTKSSRATGDMTVVAYGSGSFAGAEFEDTISLSPELPIMDQFIGSASVSEGFSGVDGILGVGPAGLTVGTLIGPHTGKSISTVTDNLYKQGRIANNMLSISYGYCDDQTRGELTFGGTDEKQFAGPITYIPITRTSPSSSYWGIDQTISYGNTAILQHNAGIVDTGTTLLLLATDSYQQYAQMTGATFDSEAGLLSITEDQYSNLKSLYFNINGVVFELVPDAQIVPRDLNQLVGGDDDKLYLIVGDLGQSSDSGMSFILGYTWLQRFYSVYDTAGGRVGIANTKCTVRNNLNH